jgi:hypothetical protein
VKALKVTSSTEPTSDYGLAQSSPLLGIWPTQAQGKQTERQVITGGGSPGQGFALGQLADFFDFGRPPHACFRLALDDEDHGRLRRTLELQLDKTMIDVHSRRAETAAEGLKST